MVDRRPIPVVVPKARVQPPSLWPSGAEQAIVWLLAVAVVAAPACFGASGIWARWTLEAAMTLAAVLWSASRLRPAALTLLPLGVTAIGLLQIASLPDSLLVRVAPISAGAWKVALGGSPADAGCISVDPSATLTAIRRLLLALAIVAAVSDLGRVPKYRLILTRALAASGVVILLAAMIFGRGQPDFTMMRGLVSLRGPIHPLFSPLITPVQGAGIGSIDPVSVGDSQYRVDSRRTGDGCAFYIYSNHFAGGVAITLPVLIAICLSTAHAHLAPVAGILGACALGSLGLWAVGWLASSLGGLATLLLEGVVLAALIAVRPRPKKVFGWTLVTLVIIGMLLLALFLGPFQGVVIRALPDSGQQIAAKIIAANGRGLAALIGLRMFRASPVLGTGLNTYQSIFPRFHEDKITFFYAHSDLAQLLAEFGGVGAVLAIVCMGALFQRGLRFYRNALPPQRTIDGGIWAAVAGLSFYSALDWNLHLPANAFLMCVVFGLAISSAASIVAAPARGNRWLQFLVQGVFAICCLAALSGLTRDAHSETAQRTLNQAILADRISAAKPDAPSPEPLLLTAIQEGDSAALRDPRNSRLLALMGQANLHLAARTADATAQGTFNDLAADWFTRAQRASAVCRGLPERRTAAP
jgi:hypothetical protein